MIKSYNPFSCNAVNLDQTDEIILHFLRRYWLDLDTRLSPALHLFFQFPPSLEKELEEDKQKKEGAHGLSSIGLHETEQ